MYNGCLDLLGLLAGSRNITSNAFDPLLNVSSLQSRAEETLAGLSHQLMRRYFFLPDDTATSGSVDYTEQKLYTRAAALWTMVGLLAVIYCLVIVLVVYGKQGVAPKSPTTLATAAYTMSRSPAMGKILGESSAIRLSEIRKALANYDFVTVQDRAGMPRIEAWKSTSWKNTKQPPDSKPKKKRPWMPYSSHSHAIALTLILPTAAIAALEILWHFSENDERFVTISSDSSIAAYAIRYGSTATVLVISTLFNALDFAIATMTPFSSLAAGEATAERTIFFTIVGDLPPVALYKAIYHMHLGAALSLIASTVGSLLTIAISGLWLSTAIEVSRDVNVEVQSTWNASFTGKGLFSDPRNGVSENTITVFNDVEHGFPDKATLIWGNVVLPRIGNPQLSITSQLRETLNGSTPQYNIAVPAVRPFLECSMLPASAIFTVSEPRDIIYTNAKTISLSHNIYDNTTSGWIGQIQDLSVTLKSNKAPSRGCPSIGAMFGTYEGFDPQPRSNITVLICTQRLQSVEANATYPGDLFSLFAPNLTTDVHLNSPTPRNLIDAESGSSSLWTEVIFAFQDLELVGPTDDADKFDSFFSRIVNGPRGISRENLIGSGNVDTLISAMNDLYQKLMVRVIDLQWRSNIGGGNTAQPTPNDGVARGTMTVAVSRLKVNKTSKIVLQAFLSTMVLLGGIACWCVDMRVLPRNPYPIASSMAFFGRSRLIGASSRATSGGEEQGQQRIIKRKPLVVVKGRRFRLGWWKDLSAEGDDDYESDSASQVPPLFGRGRFGIDVDDADSAVSLIKSRTTAVFRRKWLR
ncbi:hypothetical protein F4801DRAFT_587543 [Xylaria longipes]|nr:hypothetical protein F4801DRAFT_587543 [Xylaria longipes]